MHPEALDGCDAVGPDLVGLHCLLIDLKDPRELLLIVLGTARAIIDQCLKGSSDEEAVNGLHVQSSQRLSQLVLEELWMRAVPALLELDLETRVLVYQFLHDYLGRDALHRVFLKKSLLCADEELISSEAILLD